MFSITFLTFLLFLDDFGNYNVKKRTIVLRDTTAWFRMVPLLMITK